MTGDEVLGHAQLTTHATYLVLEQPLQGLAQLQVHLLRQSSHVMVALDDLTRDVQRLDTVGIDGALCQPFGIGNLLGFGIEHLDEVATYNLTLLLWVSDTCEVAKELFAGIDANDVQTQTTVVVHHLCELVLAQHAMINEDTGEAVADGLVQKNSSNAGVNTTRKTQNHAVIAQLNLQLSNGAVDK